MFEVQNLKYATLATVSRCGMVWFSEEVLTSEMIFENFLNSLRHTSIDEGEEYAHSRGKSDVLSPEMQVNEYIYLSNTYTYLCKIHHECTCTHVAYCICIFQSCPILCAFSIHMLNCTSFVLFMMFRCRRMLLISFLLTLPPGVLS